MEEFRSQRQIPSLTTLNLISFILDLSVSLELTYSARLTGQRSPGIFLTLPPQPRDYRC